MDAVFPVREKSVNRINSLNESTPKEEDEFRGIDAVRAKRELGSDVDKSSLQGQMNLRAIDTVFLMGQNLRISTYPSIHEIGDRDFLVKIADCANDCVSFWSRICKIVKKLTKFYIKAFSLKELLAKKV